jgi:Zn-dependent peptidase ImmA (M78 family)
MTNAKRELYSFIGSLRERIPIDLVPLSDIRPVCSEVFDIAIVERDIATKGLRGMAFPGTTPLIILDSKRSLPEQNFDCAHELVHITKHSSLKTSSRKFSCYEEILPQQIPFLEWEANEGAAELLMPYRTIIPDFFGFLRANKCMKGLALPMAYQYLALKYKVTTSAVVYRLDNLKYEMHQFYHGKHVNEITVMSKAGQIKAGIKSSQLKLEKLVEAL